MTLFNRSIYVLFLASVSYSFDLLAAPITFNSALPVAEGEFVARVQYKYFQTEKESEAPNRKIEVKAAVGVLGYGINADLTLFAILPYLDKTLDINGIQRNTKGFGDTSFFARYTVFKNNMPGKNFRIAPFAGINVASGSDGEKDEFGDAPPGLQPGSGSTDFFGGAVLTYQTLDWQIDSQVRIDLFNEGNNLEKGNKYALAGSFQYRIWPQVLESGIPGFLYLVLESELSHQQKDQLSGANNQDSGGTRWNISPGIQYVTRRWVAEVSVQLPVYENLNGRTLEADYGFSGGFRWNF